jgi:hypothetical protein
MNIAGTLLLTALLGLALISQSASAEEHVDMYTLLDASKESDNDTFYTKELRDLNELVKNLSHYVSDLEIRNKEQEEKLRK